MRPARRILPSEVYFVTIRTVEQRFALDPYAAPGTWLETREHQLKMTEKLAMRRHGESCVKRVEDLTETIAKSEQNSAIPRPEVLYSSFTDSIPNIIGSCMARGANMFNIRIYGFVWMSNHGHLLIGGETQDFADFMAYLNGQTAVNVNRFLARENQLWGRRYSSSPVLDEAAELEMLGYLLANPQNAGIADSIDSWPGLSSAMYLFRNIKQRFLNFDRTAWHKAGRPKDIAPFLGTIVLEQKLLPQLARLDEKTRRRKLRRAIKNSLQSVRENNKETEDASTSRARRTLLQRIVIATERPICAPNRPSKKSKCPLCHTTNASLRATYIEWHREFKLSYKECSRAYRMGNVSIEFPPGSFAPSKYPRANYATDANVVTRLNPTRRNLEIANGLQTIAA
jgi:REP element-mobilizing transposase RayT